MGSGAGPSPYILISCSLRSRTFRSAKGAAIHPLFAVVAQSSAGGLKPDDPGIRTLELIKTTLNPVQTFKDLQEQILHRTHRLLHRTHRLFDRLETMLYPDELNPVIAIHLGEFSFRSHVLVRTFQMRNSFHISVCHWIIP